MTKAFVLAYMVAFVASRASAFAPVSSSTRTQSFVVHDAAKQHRANKPLFMSDDDVSSIYGVVCRELYSSFAFMSNSPQDHFSIKL